MCKVESCLRLLNHKVQLMKLMLTRAIPLFNSRNNKHLCEYLFFLCVECNVFLWCWKYVSFFLVCCLKTGTQPFNRAMLFNVGFKEAMKDVVWDCIIFHDVDHLPENDRNYYGCGEMPRHFAAKLDKYMYM